jgi:uncharacterized protein YbcI
MSDELALLELQRGLSQVVTRVLAEYYGKGPARTRTYLFDDYVFAVCEDILTTAEETLRSVGEAELVQEVRLTFEDLMTKAFVAEVEKLTGRTVVAYHSQVLVEHALAFEIFMLDPTQPGVAALDTGADVRNVALASPGRPGDADALPPPGREEPPSAQGGAERPRPGQGPLRAAIGNAIVKVMHELYGRGPARTRVYLADDYVLCALERPLTTVERTLADGGRHDLVRKLRRRFVQANAARFGFAVEQLVARRVLACDSQIVFDPDVFFMTFVLEPRGGAERDGD